MNILLVSFDLDALALMVETVEDSGLWKPNIFDSTDMNEILNETAKGVRWDIALLDLCLDFPCFPKQHVFEFLRVLKSKCLAISIVSRCQCRSEIIDFLARL